MAAIGGSPFECSIRGRIFACLADSSLKITPGGKKNEIVPLGNGKGMQKKMVVIGAVEGLVVQIDNDAGDLQVLQEIADSKEFVDFSVTLADGNVYEGSVQIVDDIAYDAQAGTVELKLSADGKISKQ